MWSGFLFALGACFVWGLIFVIPDYLNEFSPLEVALGRYFAYGVVSICLLLSKGMTKIRAIPLKAWRKALVFGLFSNIFYYVGVVIGLRYATAPVTVLVLGLCPILVAIYGSREEKTQSFRTLILPCLSMSTGMVLVNISEIDWSFKESPLSDYLLGLGSVCVALISWSWFAVNNARFLKKNLDVPRSEWATLIGVGTFVWVLLALCIFGGWNEGAQIDLRKFIHLTPSSLRFLGGIAILGILCSWLGCYFWNQASSYLPFSLMGPFIIFETIFGLFFVYLFDGRLPSLLEFLGILSMLAGIFFSIIFFRKSISKAEEEIAG